MNIDDIRQSISLPNRSFVQKHPKLRSVITYLDFEKLSRSKRKLQIYYRPVYSGLLSNNFLHSTRGYFYTDLNTYRTFLIDIEYALCQ